MSKKHLENYVAGKNVVRRIFGEPELNIAKLSAQDINYLLEAIEADLSPENLTCDGELRGAALRRKQGMIMGAQDALRKMIGIAA